LLDQNRSLFIKVLAFLIIAGLIAACGRQNRQLRIQTIHPETWKDIVHVQDGLVKPVVYTHPVSLKALSIKQRKKVFIDQLLPAILIVKFQLEKEYHRVERLIRKDSDRWSRAEEAYIDSLFRVYKTQEPHHLLRRLKTHPVSLVIAQAALESAWGTSRFYTRAFNIFGTWSFDTTEARIKSKGLRNGEPVYLKKHHSLSSSVADYFLTIARGPYSEFRKAREQNADVFELASHLQNYSEENQAYIDQIIKIIKSNRLLRYDAYRIDPKFIE